MAPIGTQQSRSFQDVACSSLRYVACNSPDYIFIVWLSKTSNTFNKRINSFWFLRISLVLGSSQKVEVKLIEIWIVRWPDDISSPAIDTAMKLIKQRLELFDKI